MTGFMISAANGITIARMVLVPPFICFTLYHHYGYAMIVLLAAGLSDAVDGYAARKLKQETYLGSLLDPIADKALIISGFAVLSFEGIDSVNRVPKWLTVTVISRDGIILLSSLCILLMFGRVEFKPTLLGKVCTATQITTIGFFLLFNYLGSDSFLLELLCWLAMAVTLSSGLHYTHRAVRWTDNMGIIDDEKRAS